MQIVYSTTRHPLLTEDRKFQNPRFFTRPIDGASKVFVLGDYPEIVSAYRAAGVEVVDVEPAVAPAPAPTANQEPKAEGVAIPDGYEHLSWPDLRRLAASVSADPILNKAEAVEAIQAELGRRDALRTAEE